MRRETKRNDFVFLAIVNELDGLVTCMTINDQQPVLAANMRLGVMIKVLEPSHPNLLVSPTFRANLNDGAFIDGFRDLGLLYAFAFEDDVGRKNVTAVSDTFDDGNPFPISRLDRRRFFLFLGHNNLSIVSYPLHYALFIHIIYVVIGNVVCQANGLEKVKPLLQSFLCRGIFS